MLLIAQITFILSVVTAVICFAYPYFVMPDFLLSKKARQDRYDTLFLKSISEQERQQANQIEDDDQYRDQSDCVTDVMANNDVARLIRKETGVNGTGPFNFW